MKLKIQRITANHIICEGSTKNFIWECVEMIGIGFHPDTDFTEYIDTKTGKRIFRDDEAEELNKSMDECFTVCKKFSLDIYQIALSYTQPIFDKLAK